MAKYNHNFTSPLRYPGGKGMLSNFVKLILFQNRLTNQEYVEAFAGGASIAWTLLFDGYVKKVHINDLNRPLFAFWQSVLFHTDELCKRIFDTNVTIEEWHKQKEIQDESQKVSVIDLGFSTFFLNRTNRSGILKGGVIGGKSQSGEWKLDARFNKADLAARIMRIAANKANVKIYNKDASVFINYVLPSISEESLVYLDPPYYRKGKGLYENHYSHDDHLSIAKLVQEDIRQHWMLSYDNCNEISEMYTEHNKIEYRIMYTAQKKYSGSEVMYFSKNLSVPNVKNPAKVSSQKVDQLKLDFPISAGKKKF